jgi:FKBP-type peptidyl-prolyl cis-trans isomerase
MRIAPLAAIFFSGLAAAAALAQSGDASKQPATPPPPPAAAQPTQPTPPPAPPKVPVPDGPVVNKQELEGGLIAEDLKIGDGYEVKPGGAVVAFYHGTLKSDGTVFDSAFERGEPVAFPLSGVIPGWQKGVPGMKVGGVRRLTIPAAMAYGERSPSPKIPPNSDLVFVIQLVDALQVEDIKVGTGDDTVAGQSVAVTAFTMKDKDGKEVDKATAEKPYIWFPNEFQPITFGLEGMKTGGKRKITVPKEMNQNNGPFGQSSRPAGVPLTIEVDLIAFRNLPGRH